MDSWSTVSLPDTEMQNEMWTSLAAQVIDKLLLSESSRRHHREGGGGGGPPARTTIIIFIFIQSSAPELMIKFKVCCDQVMKKDVVVCF